MARSIREHEKHLGGDAMLGAVAFSAERLLLAEEWQEAVGDVLERLGAAAEVSRAYLIRVEAVEHDYLATQLAEWCAPGVASQFGNPTLQGAPLARTGFGRWVEIMTSHGIVQGAVRTFPDPERRELGDQDIVSIAALPVFVDGTWWAFIGFDDCVLERRWTEHELDSLRAVAGMLGAAEQRARSESRRLEAESRYQQLVEQNPAVTYTEEYGPDGPRLTFVSPQVRDLLGYPAERLLTEPDLWFGGVHPEDAARVESASADLFEAGADYDETTRMRAADGRWVWVRDIARPIRDQRGDVQHWQGFLVDIGERMETEGRLREAEERYRAMVERIPAVTYTDLVGDDGVTYMGFVSPQVEEILGYPPQRFLDHPGFWFEIMHPDDLAHLRAIDAFNNSDLGPFDHEYRMRHANGRWVWVHDISTPVLDADGNLEYFLGFLTDVSSTKDAEDRLRGAHEHLRLMVDSSLDAVVTMDEDGSITGWNPQAERTFGWAADEVIGQSLADTIVPHAHRAAHVAGLRRWRETGAGPVLNSRIEIQGLHRDGRLIPVELAIVPVAVGDQTMFSGFIRDISERKRAQEDLERALEVEREATGRLRALDEMKDTFLQAVSHDLRTPLAAILGIAITLERGHVGLEPEETRHLAGRIEHNARRLERLVTNLLDLDRLARGVLTPSFEPTDIGELVRRMVQEFDPALPDQMRLSIESVVISADPPKVERIVENLLVNAVKHTKPGTAVHVSVSGSEDGATIAVEDEGSGVPDELSERIFEEFRQGTGGPQASPGVGVGLTLVRRFAEMHHGRAWVQEREGGGASFRVFLPREHPSEDPS
jgi:PAS domain S-box-containing protein